ncbi:MAG: autotransporter outer membrane beta-barrel domain-containing protein [Lautropia sp.]|nr:autotransporter outer membrane beta-barrel domain-containing protein [Lautropia sp.]
MLPAVSARFCSDPLPAERPACPEPRARSWHAALLIAAATLLAPLSPAGASDRALEAYQKASLSFIEHTQNSIHAHQAEIRKRQKSLSRIGSRDVPRFQNLLKLADQKKSIPLQQRADLYPGQARLLNSAPGKTNLYIRGTLHSINNGSGLGLTTPGTIIGSDQQVNDEVAIGLAAARISTVKSSGNVLSAYVSVQPIRAWMLDLSVSLGSHRARHDFLRSHTDQFGIHGTSRALSLSLNRQPRSLYGWTLSPYSRYDLIATDVDASLPGSPGGWHGTQAQSSLSFGSVLETDWFGRLGQIRPRLQLEVRHQITDGSGLVAIRQKTNGMIGLGLTSRVSRDMATFAESRYAAQSGNATPESLVMLGVRLSF